MKTLRVLVIILGIIGVALAAISARAAVVYVKAGSPGPTLDGKSWQTAYHTLPEGITAASSGDEVWVGAGNYTGQATLKPGVSLYGGFAGTETSRDQRNWRANPTVLNGNRLANTLVVPSGATATTVIDGFTITGSAQCGSVIAVNGIYCDHSSPTIANNIISDNGSAIYVDNGSPLILCNEIRANFRTAIYGINYQGTIANNIIADSQVGGISVSSVGGKIINNTIVGNGLVGVGGPGLVVSGSKFTVANNIIAFNIKGVTLGRFSSFDFFNNCVYGNTVSDFYPTSPVGTNGNISADPLFANKDAGDYRLLAGSPCVDTATAAGAPAVDLAGAPRPVDGDDDGTLLPDIGCYELGVANAMRLSQIKATANGRQVGLLAPTVTASFGSYFYVENVDRTSGVMVIGAAPEIGRRVAVTGVMDTVDGERVILTEHNRRSPVDSSGSVADEPQWNRRWAARSSSWCE